MIRVDSLSLGYMMTHMLRWFQVKQPEKETLFGRTGCPDKLKGGILLLCSEVGR